MVPNQFSPHKQMVPRIFRLSRGQAVGIWKYGDQIGWGPFVQEDQILGDHLSLGTELDGDHLSRRINFMGIVCPVGQEVGDQKSGDQMGLGQNASQLN